MKFNEIIKDERIIKVLNEKGYDTPTEIQGSIIPLIIDGNDVLGQSQTGTGKTIAYLAPILQSLEDNKKLQALILAPTRELAIQIDNDIKEMSKYTNFNSVAVYGSSSIEEQIRSIKKGVEIVVGTPGRTKDLIKRNILKITEIRFFVLDEADEMLSMGFQEEIEFIFEKVNNDRQVLLFSATMPKNILKIAENYMSNDYKTISVSHEDETPKNVSQEYYLVNNKTRIESMCRIMDFYNPTRCMIFCKTKRNADEVLDKLLSRGYNANVIHGDITQSQRIQTLDQFKSGTFNYLIATDVAARGIHVNDVDIVINYNLPDSNEYYVHRIGRTGRANKSGLAITLSTPKEEKIIKTLEKKVQSSIEKKSIPTNDLILQNRVSTIIENTNKLNMIETPGYFDEYLKTLDIDQIKSLLNKLMIEKLNKSIGSDFNVNIESNAESDKSSSRKRKNTKRVFINIGKLDNLNKKDFISFLSKTANVKESDFNDMEVMPQFSFVSVNNNVVASVMKKCNKCNYRGSKINIELARK